MLKINGINGDIYLADSVIARLVGCEASACFGVVGMAARNAADSVVSLLSRDNMEKGVNIRYEHNQLYIDLHVIISHGVNIPAISQAIEEKVSYSVEKFTGVPVRSVRIFVDSIKA